MSKVVSFADRKFQKSHAGRIVAACDMLDKEVRKLVFDGDIPPGEMLVALAQRIGVYCSCIEDYEKMAQHLAKIIMRYAMKERV